MTTPTTNAKKILGLVRLEPVASRDEATALAIKLATLMNEQDKATVTCNERVEAIKQEFALHIEALAGEIDRGTKRLAQWAKANRTAEFGDKQGITLAGHRLAFRMGNGKVEFKPGIKEEDALNAILSHADETLTERFVTVKTALNKNAVISAWKSAETIRIELDAAGITVVKEESFSFDPDKDSLAQADRVSVGKEVA